MTLVPWESFYLKSWSYVVLQTLLRSGLDALKLFDILTLLLCVLDFSGSKSFYGRNKPLRSFCCLVSSSSSDSGVIPILLFGVCSLATAICSNRL